MFLILPRPLSLDLVFHPLFFLLIIVSFFLLDPFAKPPTALPFNSQSGEDALAPDDSLTRVSIFFFVNRRGLSVSPILIRDSSAQAALGVPSIFVLRLFLETPPIFSEFFVV